MKSLMQSCLALLIALPAVAQANCLQTPIPGTTITSNFGLRFHPVYHTWKSHNGTDMRASMFTKVNAANSGQVTFSGYMGSAVNTVIILGADGLQTRYFHLSKPGVSTGSSVSAGQIIGLSGDTGEASAAPHLHFEARTNGGTRPVDSRSLLCQVLPEKSDAGPEKSGNGQPQPGGGSSTPTASSGAANPSGSGGAPAKFDSLPDLNGYEGMSDQEMLLMEVSRRFLNPDWHIQMGGCGRDINQTEIDGKPHEGIDCKKFFRQELLSMTALQNMIAERRHDTEERVQAIRATQAIGRIKSNPSSTINLNLLRQKAQSMAR